MLSSILATSFIGTPPMCTLLSLINYDAYDLHLQCITKFNVQLSFIDSCNMPILTQTQWSPILAPLYPPLGSCQPDNLSWAPTPLDPAE